MKEIFGMPFWWKKTNPFITAKELAAQEITAQLIRWELADRGEILSTVLSRTFPQTHIHKNPRRIMQ